MSENRVEINPELTAIAITYRNPACIADEFFPTVPVGTRSFEYIRYDKKNNLTVPETLIGESGKPNRVTLNGHKESASVEEHALEEAISIVAQEEAKKSPNKINLKNNAVIQLTDLMKIRREINLSQKLSKKENYNGNFKELAANEKIDKDDVDVVKLFRNGIKNMLYQPNIMVCSKAAFFALQENPYIVSSVNKNNAKAGIASIEEIKKIFNVNKILIGESIQNASKKNEKPNFVSCWNNDIIFAYNNINPDLTNGVSFGYKAEYESLQVGEYYEGASGMKGADIIKTYMSYIDLITSPECAFLFKDVLTQN